MWEPHHGWRWEEFVDYLPQISYSNYSFELVAGEEEIDPMFWNGSASGGLTIRSALKIIKGELEFRATKKMVLCLEDAGSPENQVLSVVRPP